VKSSPVFYLTGSRDANKKFEEIEVTFFFYLKYAKKYMKKVPLA